MKLGFLGPVGTFSFEAAKTYCKDAELIEYRTITEAVVGLKNDEIDEAIVPIENSIQGGVTETIDALIEHNDIYVVKELVLQISHNLMANDLYKKDEIRQIYSHPQAIAQCRKYIENHLSKSEIVQVSSTALAAKEIKNMDYCACIANFSCAKEYGLQVLERNIQENDMNQTKFWVLSKTPRNDGKNLALVFSTKDEPGALYKVLGYFYNNDINLNKIESRPSKNELGSYIFLVVLDIKDNIQPSLDSLKHKCKYVKILGLF